MSNDSATSKEVGAPAREETKVTPAMIRAGVDALLLFELREDDPELMVAAVFEAMLRHA